MYNEFLCAKRLIPRPFILPVNSLENFFRKGMFRTLIFTRKVYPLCPICHAFQVLIKALNGSYCHLHRIKTLTSRLSLDRLTKTYSLPGER